MYAMAISHQPKSCHRNRQGRLPYQEGGARTVTSADRALARDPSNMDGWLLAVAGEQPGTVMADLRRPTSAFGRQGPGVVDGPADPLGEMLIGFQVIGADTQPSRHFPAAHDGRGSGCRLGQGAAVRGVDTD